MSKWTKWRDKVTKPVVVVVEVAKDAVEDAGKIAEKVGKEAGNAAEGATEGVGDAAEGLGKAGEKAANATGEALGNIGKAGEKAVKDTGDALEDAGQALKEGVENLTDEAKSLLRKTNAELGRAYTNVEDLASASYHFIENQVDAYISIAKDTAKAALRGQLADVVFQLSVQPWKVQEESAFEAIGESKLMKYIATAAASTYGGPGGAAAFAAWYAYRCTGDLELAIKAGAIAWATSEGLAATLEIPGAAQRAVASAAIGGAAVAASGGSRDDVLNAFVRGAELGAVRAAYKEFMDAELTGEPATQDAELKIDGQGRPRIVGSWRALQDDEGNLITDQDGNAQIDITSMPKTVSHVGFASSSTNVPDLGFDETSALMQTVSKLPYFNDMAYFHDQWMAVAQQGGLTVPITVLPAIIVIGAGADPVITGPATEEIIDGKKKP